MSGAQLFLFWMCIFGAVVGLFAMARNQSVFKVRIAYLHDSLGMDKYLSLPSYEDMVESPKYWGLWTKAQWDKWLEAKS